ncbi:MAG: hypothetical protein AAB215_02390 [Planctomycetota bacterium]
MRAISAAALLAFLFIPFDASADIVRLQNGEAIEGKIVSDEQGKPLKIELEHGTMECARDKIVSIERGPTVREQLEARRKDLPNTADAHASLGKWCEGKRLPAEAKREYEAAVKIDPDHAAARAALGHEKIHGVWLDADAAKRAMGWVLVDGKWLSPEEREKEIVRAKEEAGAARADAEAARAETLDLKARLEGAQGEIVRLATVLAELQSQIDRLRAALASPPIIIVQPPPARPAVWPPPHRKGDEKKKKGDDRDDTDSKDNPHGHGAPPPAVP